MTACLAATLALLLAGVALAHAEFEAATPAPETVVTGPLSQIELSFTEPVETRFSIFKVYRLEAEVDLSANNAWQRLNGLAGALVSEVLTAQEDGEARADTGPAGEAGQSRVVVLGLEPDMAPDFYVVMWRLLSVDTHSTQGFYVFGYQPNDARTDAPQAK